MSDEPTQNNDAIVNLAGKMMRSHAEAVEAGLNKSALPQIQAADLPIQYDMGGLVTNSKPQPVVDQANNKTPPSEG